MPASTESAFINTLIGEGSLVRGDLVVQGFFRLDGDFMGSVRTGGRVLVAVSGRAKGEIHARSVVIAGVFRGDIYASEKVVLLSTAMVLGNIYTSRLEIDLGAFLDGYACVTSKIREEGPLSVHVQSTYVLKIDPKLFVDSPLSHFSS